MIARLLRLVVLLALAVAVALLVFYAFIAALIILPIVLLLFFLFGRKVGTRFGNVWVVGGAPQAPPHRPAPGSGPLIDHDPADLPPKGEDDKL